MKPTDISFDLETLSTRSDAAIISIGAQAFNRNTGEMGAVLYYTIDLADAVQRGHVDGDTIAWWMRQSEAARSVFQAPGRVPLGQALEQLVNFVERAALDAEMPGMKVWGNGATFDISILEHAYRKCGMDEPWKFWDIRDMRTIVEAAEEIGFNKRLVEFDGVAHNALADATHQAKIISMCWQRLTRLPETPPQHGDDTAVDRFAAAMKKRMAAMRAVGRSGWRDECPMDMLMRGMRSNAAGPSSTVDTANYAMMLWNRSNPNE